MKIKRLVIGTSNKGKLNEWLKILSELLPKTEIIGISELGDFPDPKETGNTFEENAKQKAAYYAKLVGEYVLSEDGGYEVEALGGAPGVKSRRILPGGKEGTDQELIDYVLGKLRGAPLEKRGVALTAAAALSDPKGNIIFQDRESMEGAVTERPGPILIPGYPFRTIHYISELKKTYAELTDDEHKKFGHKREIALKLAKFIISTLEV